jgi:hypothetical protein
LCAGALVFALLRFNPFEPLSSDVLRQTHTKQPSSWFEFVASNKPEQPLLLKDLIRQVRAELTEAVNKRKRNNEPGIFVVENLTLEVNFAIEKEQTLGAKPS